MANPLAYRIGYVTQPQLPLDRVAAIGIKYLEIVMKEGETVDDILRTLEPHGLQVSTVHATPGLHHESFVERFREFIDWCHQLGGLGLFASFHAGDMPRDTAYALLRRIGDLAAEKDVFIAMETHLDLCENGSKAAETLAAVDHPAIGWNLDTANVYYYNRDVNVVEEARKAARFVRSVHAKDTTGGFEDPNFPNIGEGVVDFAGVDRVLRDVEFMGPWTMELEGVAGSADSAEKMEANVRACAGHLRNLGIVE